MEFKYKGYLNIAEDIHEENGERIVREVMTKESGNKTDECVAGVLYDPDKKKIYLANQYRPASGSKLLEVVAGTMEKGENPQECFAREAMEEVGFDIKYIEKVNTYYTSPGITKEKIHLYIGVGERIEKGGGLDEENENIEVIEMPVFEFVNYNFDDMKSELIKNIFKYEYTQR